MPTVLGAPFALSWGGVPPHMSWEDHAIWERYRRGGLTGAVRLYFDVGVGGPFEVNEGVSLPLSYAWQRLLQKRIDVVAEYPERWDLVELRFHASANALGRLLSYHVLWNDDPPSPAPVRLVLVTDRVDRDVARAADALGVVLVVV